MQKCCCEYESVLRREKESETKTEMGRNRIVHKCCCECLKEEERKRDED